MNSEAFVVSFLCSGIGVLTFYNVQIVEATGAPVNANHTAVAFGIIRLFFNIGGCYLMTFCNRRTLTVVSGVTSGLAMISLATHHYLTKTGQAPWQDEWLWRHLPIAIIVTFYMCYSMGYLLIPWVLTGEMYPAKIRGLLGGITVCFAHSLLFATVKSFPFLIENLGFDGSFWFYGSTVAIGSMTLYVILPETRGRTLFEIESRFKRRAIIRESFKGSFLKC
jgi:facilitated trehalose transporter